MAVFLEAGSYVYVHNARIVLGKEIIKGLTFGGLPKLLFLKVVFLFHLLRVEKDRLVNIYIIK